jgi:hypothetical protein
MQIIKCNTAYSRSKDKKHLTISLDAFFLQEPFNKLQHHYIIKGVMKLEIEEMYLNIIRLHITKL